MTRNSDPVRCPLAGYPTALAVLPLTCEVRLNILSTLPLGRPDRAPGQSIALLRFVVAQVGPAGEFLNVCLAEWSQRHSRGLAFGNSPGSLHIGRPHRNGG